MSVGPTDVPIGRPPRNDTPAKDTAAFVLLVSAVGGRRDRALLLPVRGRPRSKFCALIGIAISAKHRRFGLYTTLGITVAFVVGASICVWYSNPLY